MKDALQDNLRYSHRLCNGLLDSTRSDEQEAKCSSLLELAFTVDIWKIVESTLVVLPGRM